MKLKYNYQCFPAVVNKEICESIIQEGLVTQPIEAKTQGDNSGLLDRRSKIAWLYNQNLYEMLTYYLELANTQAGWNFEWDYCEPMQFTQYVGGDYYDWHQDGGSDHTFALKRYIYGITPEPLRSDGRLPKGYIRESNMVGKVRKLSLTLNLTDPNNYTGGAFEFENSVCQESMSQGSIIVFPSFINHRVNPVLLGTRHSIVLWAMGKPFK
jgi:PKHD-type hydroxylase